MNEMKTICRFCMKTTEKPLLIDKMTKEIVEILMPKLDLKITPESVLCYGCAETLQTAFDFKSACIYTKDCLYPFIEGRCEARLDLQEIYLKVNDNKDIDSVKGREVCRFCMKPCNSDRCTPIDVIEENVEIKKLLEDYLPEVVKGVIEKPVACENCRNFLHQYSLFVTSFSGVEQQIQSYAKKTLGRDCISEIDLSQVRDFSLGNVTKRGVETIVNDKVMEEGVIIFSEIEREEIKCEEKEICESKIDVAALETERREQEEFDSFAGSDELFRSNQVPLIEEAHADIEMKCPFLEPLETEIKVKYFEEDVIHIEEMKGESEENERALSPHRIEECQELEGCLGIKLEGFEIKKDDDGNENNTVSLIDPSIIFSEDIEIKPTVVETTYNPEATHTAIESGPHQNAPEIETSLQVKSVQDVEGTFYHCELCPYKAKFNCYLTRHMLVHKDISEVTAHRCNLCPYETKRKHDLTAHMLIHKDPSEVTTYHCNFCSYKTKRRRRLNLHMLVHKNTSEVTTY
ncbi:hypothetical protein NQ318_000035 [Aromia moschata]|uniref:C2H2-type domain-containing protein n=1 Tax=Aromia moschata TaxID=1265417 RepID=A0AAV8YB43_9CUCU|nr:hypothetical protein NQ318_000035 [Aromia moschata]